MERKGTTASSLAIAAVVAGALAVGLAAVVSWDTRGERGSGLSERFVYDLNPLARIDPALVTFAETGRIEVSANRLSALAVGRDDEVYVAGDAAVFHFDAAGTLLGRFEIPEPATCLAVAGKEHEHPGRIYAGLANRVEVYDAAGTRVASWDDLDERSLITSIALGYDEVFVADAGNRRVLRYDTYGELAGEIGGQNEERGTPRFIVPSPAFDMAMGADGLLRVVNPGYHRIETYSPAGSFYEELAWGETGFSIEGFSGCCNPAHIALLPDGRFVTVEKGLVRVKVYSSQGEFEGVVAGPEDLGLSARAMEETRARFRPGDTDLAADSRGRVLLIDPRRPFVRIFEEEGEG